LSFTQFCNRFDSMKTTSGYVVLIFIIFWMAADPVELLASNDEATLYRDGYGIPHIFAPNLEAAAYAVGYAQAEDRLEALLKNYRLARGAMAEAFGAEYYSHDLTQRFWQHAEISRSRYDAVSPKMRAVIQSYQNGIRKFMKEHPEKVPTWAQEIYPWDVIALLRYIIFPWPQREASEDLRRAGITLTLTDYRGSNEMLIAPQRTAMGAPIAIIDPHVSWYNELRFYQVRIYAGDFNVSGVSILGVPIPILGHSRWCSVAMTTGGPDTSDIFEEEINPANPRQYRVDGQYRDMNVRAEKIAVKEGDEVKWREVEIESTRHGPVVARKEGKAYTMAIPYAREVGLADQTYQMMTARNLVQMKQALGQLQLMAQNVMVGTVQGEIYYLRNGRVPIRPTGVDPSRPIPGNTSANEWQGIHPITDLVQITNPATGWMQNCNLSPSAMMVDSPLVPEKYLAYLYNSTRQPAHQRGAMVNKWLDTHAKVTLEQAIDLAFLTEIYHAELWQARLRKAWAATGTKSGDVAEVVSQIGQWNRRSDPDSAGALAFYAFKLSLPSESAKLVDPPDTLTDGELLAALPKAAEWLRRNFGTMRVPFGQYFRVGRRGSAPTWPVGGGSLREVGMETPRSIVFALAGKEQVGHTGQSSTQIVILTDPPQSWAVLPLGESDDPESPHFHDQAEKLFSKGTAAPTYFMNQTELVRHVTGKRVLTTSSSRGLR